MKYTPAGLACLPALLFLLLFPLLAGGYTFEQIGVASNFLVESGKVHFVQSDGRMTVLELDSGKVLARSTKPVSGFTLERVEHGILVRGSGTSLLDAKTLEEMWTFPAYKIQVTGDRLICEDRAGIRCQDLRTAERLWTYRLDGAIDYAAEKGKVLVFRESRFEGPGGVPAVALLDLATGKEIFRRTTPPKVHFLDAFFDGERIYLPAGSFSGAHVPNITRYDSGRPAATYERMLVWDLEGNEVESIKAAKRAQLTTPDGGTAYAFRGKVLARNRVWASLDHVPPWTAGRGKAIKDGDYIGGKTFQLGDATMKCWSRQTLKGELLHASFRSPAHTWAGHAPYLDTRDAKIVTVEATKELVLLGSNMGHVEAVERTSGRSVWMYRFPTTKATMSYSSNSLPPSMATAAKNFRRENEQLRTPVAGFSLRGSQAPSSPVITVDPDPFNPYSNLRYYQAIAWVGVLGPLALTGFAIFAYRWEKRRSLGQAILCLLSAIAAVLAFRYFGRVSALAGIGLLFAIAIPLLATFVFAFVTIGNKQRVAGWFVFALALGLAFYMSRFFFGWL